MAADASWNFAVRSLDAGVCAGQASGVTRRNTARDRFRPETKLRPIGEGIIAVALVLSGWGLFLVGFIRRFYTHANFLRQSLPEKKNPPAACRKDSEV